MFVGSSWIFLEREKELRDETDVGDLFMQSETLTMHGMKAILSIKANLWC